MRFASDNLLSGVELVDLIPGTIVSYETFICAGSDKSSRDQIETALGAVWTLQVDTSGGKNPVEKV